MTDAAPLKPERKRSAGTPKDPSGLPSRTVTTRSKSARSRAAAGAVDAADADPQVSAAEEAARREALDLARRAVDLAEDKKASDIVLLELHGLTTLTDYFVICSGGSERQLQGDRGRDRGGPARTRGVARSGEKVERQRTGCCSTTDR